jgi:hypothetical protein
MMVAAVCGGLIQMLLTLMDSGSRQRLVSGMTLSDQEGQTSYLSILLAEICSLGPLGLQIQVLEHFSFYSIRELELVELTLSFRWILTVMFFQLLIPVLLLVRSGKASRSMIQLIMMSTLLVKPS